MALPAKTVVVLPGLDGTGDLLDGFCAAAPNGVECVVVRHPVDQALDYEALERLVAGQLPVDRSFVLVGESFSGPIAVRLAEFSRVTCDEEMSPRRRATGFRLPPAFAGSGLHTLGHPPEAGC